MRIVWTKAEAYLGGGHWAMAPLLANKIFFDILQKLENLVWPPFVWALVASENLPPPLFEILNTPLNQGDLESVSRAILLN